MLFKSHFLAISVLISLTTWSNLIYGQSTCSCDFVNNILLNCLVETATPGLCNPVACQPSLSCVAESSFTCVVSTESRSFLQFTGNVGQDEPCVQVSVTVDVIKPYGFDFTFDATPNSDVTPPFVGSGTFTFDDFQNKPDGTYALTSLPNYQFFFNFSGTTYTNANIITPLANIQVRITTVGVARFVTFGGSTGGPYGGSIDMIQLGSPVSFQPNFGTLYFRNSDYGTFEGLYLTAPQPATATGPIPIQRATTEVASLDKTTKMSSSEMRWSS